MFLVCSNSYLCTLIIATNLFPIQIQNPNDNPTRWCPSSLAFSWCQGTPISLWFMVDISNYLPNWWYTYPPEKYESQIGSSSQLLGKIKAMFQTTNQYGL